MTGSQPDRSKKLNFVNWSDRQFDWSNCKPLRVVGAISGTSVDAIDVACVDIQATIDLDVSPLHVSVVESRTVAYPPGLRDRILAVAAGEALSVEALAELDDNIARAFAEAVIEVREAISARGDTRSIDAIGSHGQTVFHRPPSEGMSGYSVQLGRGETISTIAGCTTVSNFRAADLAFGGHGAPLVPRLDDLLLSHPSEHRCIQNIGGIGNVTYLPPANLDGRQIVGWDTGPGNVLVDLAVDRLSEGQLAYDNGGQWAASGTICDCLVDEWLRQDYLQLPPPKSTGRELYSPTDLTARLLDCDRLNLAPEDRLATLTDFTARSIVNSYRQFLPRLPDRVGICGGGARNRYLMARLQAHLPEIPVQSTAALGLDPDSKEAIAFALLAYLRLHEIPGNLPSVTGAQRWCLLGEIHAQ